MNYSIMGSFLTAKSSFLHVNQTLPISQFFIFKKINRFLCSLSTSNNDKTEQRRLLNTYYQSLNDPFLCNKNRLYANIFGSYCNFSQNKLDSNISNFKRNKSGLNADSHHNITDEDIYHDQDDICDDRVYIDIGNNSDIITDKSSENIQEKEVDIKIGLTNNAKYSKNISNLAENSKNINNLGKNLKQTHDFMSINNPNHENTSTNISLQDQQIYRDSCDIIPIVTLSDEIIGSGSKVDCHLRQANGFSFLHRAFSVLIFNDVGKLLVQQRSSNKSLFPLYFSNSCCSHPLINHQNEIDSNLPFTSICNSAKRRLDYELGINSNAIEYNQFKLVGRYIYDFDYSKKWGEHELDYVLIVKKSLDLNINLDEVAQTRYVSYNELLENIDNGSFIITPWFLQFIKLDFIKDWFKDVELDNLSQYDIYNDSNLPKIIII